MISRRAIMLTAMALMAAAVIPLSTASAKVPGPNGRIVFSQFDPNFEQTFTYTVNPDGTALRPLFQRGQSEAPHWAPSGRRIAIFCCDNGMVAHIISPGTKRFHQLPNHYPALELHCGFSWSRDGRLACEGFGVTDPSLTGIYSIRARDGRGLQRITTNPGGDDIPGDYSPDGHRMVFIRMNGNGDTVGLFVKTLGGGHAHRITPHGMPPLTDSRGSWSPYGDKIVFTTQTAPNRQPALWIVRANGRRLHRVHIHPDCGGLSSNPQALACFEPSWSPNGHRIVFVRTNPGGGFDIYTVGVGGRGLVRVTRSGRALEPDWGPHALIRS
jgi:WD40-like Beta Propeller Repeat